MLEAEMEGDTGQPVGAEVDPSGTPMGGDCYASAHERLRVVPGALSYVPVGGLRLRWEWWVALAIRS